MNTIDMASLPTIRFAHIFSIASYENVFTPKDNFIEITYVSEGCITLEYDGKKKIAKKGDVVCLLYNTHVRITADAFHEHHTVGMRVHWKTLDNNTAGLYLPLVTPAELVSGKINKLIDQIIEEQFTYMDFATKGTAKIFSLLCEIDACNRKAQRPTLPSEHLYAQQAKAYIHKNIHAPITQAAIAEHLGITPEYLCTVFKKAEGLTLIKYCNQLKLQKIEELMERENMRLHEAAALFGFNDPNYVSTLFKKYRGYSVTKKHKR